MVKKSGALNRERDKGRAEQKREREDYLRALRRLREIGEKLPAVDAAAVVREGRDLAGRVSR